MPKEPLVRDLGKLRVELPMGLGRLGVGWAAQPPRAVGRGALVMLATPSPGHTRWWVGELFKCQPEKRGPLVSLLRSTYVSGSPTGEGRLRGPVSPVDGMGGDWEWGWAGGEEECLL